MRRGVVDLSPIQQIWEAGGPFDSDGRVTIEFGYELRESAPGTLGPYARGPVRWFQRYDNIQRETIVPNIKSIQIDRRLDQDAQTCSITMLNTQMTSTGQPLYTPDPQYPGLPGFFGFSRGESPDETALWPNHVHSDWHRQITPNALIRTYQGYGGRNLSIPAACAAGYLVRTGTWLVDEVTNDSGGMIKINCRDMAKLLVEQRLYPPLLPRSCYPLQYARPDLGLPPDVGVPGMAGLQYYMDFAEIVKDIALWCGWWWFDRFEASGGPALFGDLETTGAWDTQGVVDMSIFDKQAAMDAISRIKEIVGYIAFVDESGGFHFHSPNHFMGGNRLHETGQRVDVVPLISELQDLVNYSVTLSDRSARTEIIMASDDPAVLSGAPGTVAASYKPPYTNFYHVPAGSLAGGTPVVIDPDSAYGDLLRGMQRPTIIPIPLDKGVTQDEAFRMALLLSLYTTFTMRQSRASCAANPLVQIDDQVRIRERVTSEVYLHYIRGISTTHDIETGEYTMDLDSYWLGDQTNWVLGSSEAQIDTFMKFFSTYTGGRKLVPGSLPSFNGTADTL